jgi:hypothetical protein
VIELNPTSGKNSCLTGVLAAISDWRRAVVIGSRWGWSSAKSSGDITFSRRLRTLDC